MLTKTILFVQLLLVCSFSYAQIDREFWFAAPDVLAHTQNYDKPIVVRLTTFSSPTTVTISIPSNPAFAPIITNIPANATNTIDLTTWIDQIENTANNTVANKGLLIQSTADITAYYEVVSSYCVCNPEIFALKGKNALGTEFYISSQNTYAIDTVRHPLANTSFDIVATEDNTNITITPSKELLGRPARIPFTITLNKGQTFSCVGKYRDKDSHLHGSYLNADKPIAVTLKGDLTFGDGTCADLIGDQTIPTSILGNEYIVTKGYLIPQDRVYILAIEDNCNIYLDGNATPAATLLKGQTWSFNLSNNSSYIRADKKIYVYQVTGNGCELGSAIIPKLNCTGSQSVSVVRSSNEPFAVMITTQNGTQNNFMVNGNPLLITAASFSPVPGTSGGYLSARVDLAGSVSTGSAVNISNSSGKFSLGFINGTPVGGCRYGFFSDFKSSNVQKSQIDICQGDSAQLTAFGGVTYQWSPATGLSNTAIATPKASPSVTTEYRVIITDGNGCVDSAFVKVIVLAKPAHTPTQAIDICTGSNIKIGTGVKPAQYTWNTGATTDSIVVNTAGTYWVQTDIYGCSNKDSMKITEVPTPIVNLGADASSCTIPNTVLDAGNAGSTYLWQDGSTSQTLTVNAFGKYYVRVTNAIGCESSDTITLSQLIGVPANFSYKQDICNPFEVLFTATGNNPLNPYWSFGDGNSIAGSLTATNTYTGYGNYPVKFGYESNGCKDTITRIVAINVTQDNIILTPDTTICFNTTKQLRTQPALSFCWSPTTWLSDPNSPSPVTSTPGNITYYFTAKMQSYNRIINGDFGGGAVYGFYTDYVKKYPNTGEGEYAGYDNPHRWNPAMAACRDHTDGYSLMFMANGSTNPNAFLWSQNINNLTPNTDYVFSTWLQNINTKGINSNPPRLQFSVNGQLLGNVFQANYTSCVWERFYVIWNSGSNTSANISIKNHNIDKEGNDFALDDIFFAPIYVQRDSVIITVDTPAVFTRTDTTICKDEQVQLQASGAATYTWMPTAGLSNTTISNPVATPIVNTEYIVTGINVNGCEAKDTANINVFPIPTVITDHDVIVCPNTTVQLSANNAMTSWLWTPALNLNSTVIANPMVRPTNNITYTVQVKDVNNCSYSDTVHVQILDSRFSLEGVNRIICQGTSVTLKATGGDSWLWSPAASLDDATIATPVATPDTSTTYTVYAKENTCGTDSTMQVRVNINPSPVVDASKTNDINCVVHTSQLHASGTPGTSYLWAPATSLDKSNQPNPVASPDTTTRYYVTGSNQYGCSSVDSVTVYVEAEGKVTFMVPNAFTPNGDGRNDCFGVKSWGGVIIEEFAIFNRWGQRVFISNNSTACWNGRFKGEPQPSGGYVYVIKAKTFCGSIKRTGTVMLMR